MEYRYRMSQNDLAHTYESANTRMDAHPDFAKSQNDIIKPLSCFKNEKEALLAAIEIEKKNPYTCQIWAKIEKSDDIYRITDYWLVTDDIDVKSAAEYIGMALMYDETRLATIIQDNVKVDDVVAYW